MISRSAADMLEAYNTFPKILVTECGYTFVYNCLNYVKYKKSDWQISRFYIQLDCGLLYVIKSNFR